LLRNSPDLAVDYVPIDNLTPHASNARVHSKRQIKLLAGSVEEFGCTRPILVDASGRIFAGHGLWAALKLLNWTSVPVIRLEGLTEDQVRAYVIADNRLAELSTWDKSVLAVELQHLIHSEAIDVSITGFEMGEIDLIIQNENAAPPAETDGEAAPSGPTTTQAGDLWHLGEHKILCADATDRASYSKLLGSERVRMVFSDPPYNVPIEGHVCGKGQIHHREFAMASGEMDRDEFIQFLRTVFALMCEFSMAGALHYLCMDWRHVDEITAAGRQTYRDLKNICVWAKSNAGMGSLYRSQHEFVFVFKHGTAAHCNNVKLGKFGRNRTNLWNYPNPTSFGRSGEDGNLLAVHPTVKPVALVSDAILDASNRGDIIFDAFLGSGTTLISCARVGRICRAMEIDPTYVDAAIRRRQELRRNRPGQGIMSKKPNAEYEVGFGRPPRASQFKPGQSGNPKGRGKGRMNFSTELERELRTSITVTENGKTHKIPKQRAIVKQTVNKAASGDAKHLGVIFQHARQQEAAASSAPSEYAYDSEEDRSVMENIRRRILDQKTGASAPDAPIAFSPKPKQKKGKKTQ
jgi:DNA modification methylase